MPLTEKDLRLKVEEALGEFDNWPGSRFHYDELRGRLSAVLGAVADEAREECAKIAETRYAHHPVGSMSDLVKAAAIGVAEAIRAAK